MAITVEEQRPPPIRRIPEGEQLARRDPRASALAAAWLLVALVVTVFVFYRGNVIGGWDWPGVDGVRLTQETRHLLLHPFPTPVTSAQQSTESRASDVVYTAMMTAVSSLSGVSAADLIRVPAGVCLYLLGCLFLIRSVSRGLRLDLPFAYLLASAIVCSSIYWVSVLWILNEDPFGWFLLLVSWGLLVRAKCTPVRSRDAVLYTALWVGVMLAMNYTYPTVMTVNLIACCSILGYIILRSAIERLRGGAVPAGRSAAEVFLGTATIAVVAYTLHPFFDNAMDVLKTPKTALETLIGFFHRAATSRYEAFVTLSPLVIRLLLIQVAILAACCLVARLIGERRAGRWHPFGVWTVLDGLFITALAMPALAVAWGNSRVFEAVAILMPVTACALVALPARRRIRAAAGLALVAASLAAAVAFACDPAGLHLSGISAAEMDAGAWAGNTISGPYFADLEVINPALMTNPHSLADAPAVSQGDTSEIAGFYSGGDGLANALLRDGYPLAIFTEQNFTLRISIADYPIAPIGREAVLNSGRFDTIYDNGGAEAFTVLPPSGG